MDISDDLSDIFSAVGSFLVACVFALTGLIVGTVVMLIITLVATVRYNVPEFREWTNDNQIKYGLIMSLLVVVATVGEFAF